MKIQELKNSSTKIGQLYPILIDNHGNIIDGKHRLKSDKKWRRVKLKNIKTTEDLLIARFACNTIRRNVSDKEKRELLNKLAEIYLSQGIQIGKISYEIARQTGMSYRWVAKYLPSKFKDQVQSDRKRKLVAHLATNSLNLKKPPKGAFEIKVYKNTNFVSFIIKKSLFKKLMEKAQQQETTPKQLLYDAILLVLTKEKRLYHIANV